MASAFPFAVSQLRLGALLGFLDPAHHVCAIGGLRAVPVIFRPQAFKLSLDVLASARLVIVPFVQNQPLFEARIRAGDADAVSFA